MEVSLGIERLGTWVVGLGVRYRDRQPPIRQATFGTHDSRPSTQDPAAPRQSFPAPYRHRTRPRPGAVRDAACSFPRPVAEGHCGMSPGPIVAAGLPPAPGCFDL